MKKFVALTPALLMTLVAPATAFAQESHTVDNNAVGIDAEVLSTGLNLTECGDDAVRILRAGSAAVMSTAEDTRTGHLRGVLSVGPEIEAIAQPAADATSHCLI